MFLHLAVSGFPARFRVLGYRCRSTDANVSTDVATVFQHVYILYFYMFVCLYLSVCMNLTTESPRLAVLQAHRDHIWKNSISCLLVVSYPVLSLLLS